MLVFVHYGIKKYTFEENYEIYALYLPFSLNKDCYWCHLSNETNYDFKKQKYYSLLSNNQLNYKKLSLINYTPEVSLVSFLLVKKFTSRILPFLLVKKFQIFLLQTYSMGNYCI